MKLSKKLPKWFMKYSNSPSRLFTYRSLKAPKVVHENLEVPLKGLESPSKSSINVSKSPLWLSLMVPGTTQSVA